MIAPPTVPLLIVIFWSFEQSSSSVTKLYLSRPLQWKGIAFQTPVETTRCSFSLGVLVLHLSEICNEAKISSTETRLLPSSDELFPLFPSHWENYAAFISDCYLCKSRDRSRECGRLVLESQLIWLKGSTSKISCGEEDTSPDHAFFPSIWDENLLLV